MSRRRALCVLLSAVLLAGPLSAADKRTPPPDLSGLQGLEAQAFHLGLGAVMWGYPMVLFEQLMRARTSPDIVASGSPQAAVNQFGLVRDLRGPESKQIATPNNDTLYAQAFVDVTREPLVLSVPAVEDDRYYAFQLWDPNGDTFAYVGSRATGRLSGDYALVAPGWSGVLPKGVTRIDAPYSSFVVWGRIGVDGPDDVAAARAIQDALRLVPLSRFGLAADQPAPDLAFSQSRVAFDPPAELPDDLMIYAELANALRFTPPKPRDAVVAASLSSIGFTNANTTFDPSRLSNAERSGLAKAATFALHVMDVQAQTTGRTVNGWRWSPTSGIMGTDYLFRAAFAKWFTGGNAPIEAIYMDGRVDDRGDAFDGANSYTMTFPAGQTPPVNAFWSLSMYNLDDGSFVENDAERYSIGDRTPGLVTAADGSLTLTLQRDAPTDPAAKANWLPTPAGGFYLDLRLYVPDDSLATGAWAPPPVMRAQ